MTTATIDKAAVMYHAGRVTRDSDGVNATRYRVQGDTGSYVVLLWWTPLNDDEHGWCTCPARVQCSHIAACLLHREEAAAESDDDGEYVSTTPLPDGPVTELLGLDEDVFPCPTH